MIQTAEGGLNEVHSILQRVRELADQSANGTNTADDRKAIQDEVKELKDEIDRIGNTTEFNTQKLLNGNLKAAGGASVGQNSTTGAIVAKQAAGTISGALTNAVAGDFVAETIKVDGTDITVNWQNLSSDEQNVLTSAATDANSMQKAAELIESKINEAIDASGTNVAHVNAYSDGTKLTVESGTKGVDSKVISGGAAGTSLLYDMTAGVASVNTPGTSVYNGTKVTSGDLYNATINGVTMEVTAGADYGNGDDMADIAAQMELDINGAIATANGSAGATTSADPGFIADVKVNATKDGGFEIISESGPISLSDKTGKTAVADLGLSQAQTEASGNGGMTFQIGANKGQTITFGVNDMRSAALGISGVDVSTQAGASNALKSLDTAIKSVSSERSKLGAVQNRLEHTINNLNTSSENLTAAESRIRDVDYALAAQTVTSTVVLAGNGQRLLSGELLENPQSFSCHNVVENDMRDGLKKEKIGQSAAKLLSRKSGEGSTTRKPSKAKAMTMNPQVKQCIISIVNPKCPTPTRLLEGEDIVQSFVKANVRTMAKEMMNQTKNSILSQAAQAMLAQSNQMPQGVLQLLR